MPRMWLEMWKRRFLNEFSQCLATAPGLGCWDAQRTLIFQQSNFQMNFPRPGKNMWPLSGRSDGFGKAAWQEGVHDEVSEGHQKHLACLATDMDQAVEEETPQ